MESIVNINELTEVHTFSDSHGVFYEFLMMINISIGPFRRMK